MQVFVYLPCHIYILRIPALFYVALYCYANCAINKWKVTCIWVDHVIFSWKEKLCITFLYICHISKYWMGNITKRLGFSFNSGSMDGSKGTAVLLAKEVPALLVVLALFEVASLATGSSVPMDILRTLFTFSARILRGL